MPRPVPGPVIFLLAAYMWFGPRPADAAVEDYRALPIASISFRPELQPIQAAELRALLPFRVNDTLDPAVVRTAIERLYATGRFREIAVEAAREGNGVGLTIVTKGTWFIGRVSADRVHEPPNRGQLVAATKLQLGEEFDNEQLRQAVENLRAKLEANGFFEARIDPELTYDEARQQVHIGMRIDAGPRARFTTPRIEGLDAAQTARFLRDTRWRRLGGLLGWKTVTESRVQRGLERARVSFAKRDLLLNRVALESMDYSAPDRTATPVLRVDPGPRVDIRTQGAKLSRGRLRQLAPVYQEQSVDRDLLVEGMRNIAAYFQGQGYFRAKVDFQTDTAPDGHRLVTYFVDRGTRYKLARLRIAGNRYFSSATVRERLTVFPATRVRFRRGRFSEALLRADMDAIRELYDSNGFRSVQVRSRTEEGYGGKAEDLAVDIVIEEGPQWFIARQEITGAEEKDLQALTQQMASVEGQPYSEANLAQDRDAILNYFFNRGYPDAKMEWTVTPAAAANQVNVRFDIAQGQPRFVRGFLVGGLETTDPDLVFQRIRLSEGDALSQSLMVESQRRLYDLGIFARVDMAVQNPQGSEPGKYLLYQFEEGRKYSLNLGIGAEIARIGGGTPNFDAPAGEPGFSPRASIGLTRTNMFGTGHTLGFQSRFSNIQKRVLASYLAPQFKGNEAVALTFSGLYDISRDIRTFESRRLEGALQLSQRLSRANTLQTRFAYRRNTVENLAIDADSIPIYSRPVRVGVLSSTLFQDHRDDPIDSHRGYYNSVDLAYASKAFASQTDYLRLLARNSTYHRVSRDVVFARSLTFGLIGNLRQGGPPGIPLPERYFSGGAATHRGFPDNQAGPRDLATGFPLGGSALLMNNFELRFPLYGDNVGAVLFHDAGNVYRGVGDLSFRIRQRNVQDFDYMVHAVGLGFRYKTPVGPVRVDFAFPANSPRFQFERRTGLAPGEMPPLVTQRINRFQFHFSLGQTF